jgi:hypothetical protein
MLLLLIVAAFPDVVSGTSSFFYRDFELFGYPNAYYHRLLFWRGEMPLWNPYNDCGTPFLAQWNTMTLYPGTLLYMVLPLPWSLSLFSLAHVWLAGIAMAALARRWTRNDWAAAVAGTAYALNGFSLHALMWPHLIASLAWAPLVVLWAEQGWKEGGLGLPKAVFAGTIQMLTGGVEVIVFTWLIAGLLWISHAIDQRHEIVRTGARLLAMVMLIAGLSAAQLLPFFELLRDSQRSSAFGGTDWSMPGWGWANLLVPLFHCSKSIQGVYSQEAQQWTSSYYLGIGTLAFALLALWNHRNRRVWLLGGVALIALFLAQGNQSILYPALKRILPQVGFARYPVKFVVLMIVSVPVLAAFGVSALEARTDRRGMRRQVLMLGGCLFALIICIACWAASRPVLHERIPATLWSAASRAVLLVLILAIVVALIRVTQVNEIEASTRGESPEPAHNGYTGALLRLAVVLLVALDTFTHTPRQNPTVPLAALQEPPRTATDSKANWSGRALIMPSIQRFLEHAANPDPVAHHLGHRQIMMGNLNLLQSTPKVDGFFPLMIRSMATIEGLVTASDPRLPSGLLDFLGVTQISAEDEPFAWRTRNTASRLITAGQQPIFADPIATVRGLADPGFSSRTAVFLPESARSVNAPFTRATVDIVAAKVDPHCVEAEVNAAKDTWMVVAQALHSPWRGFVDGHRVRIWPANLAFQAIRIPAGAHRVRLEYVDGAFRAGVLLSMMSLAFVGVLALFNKYI